MNVSETTRPLDISVHCIPFENDFLLYDARNFAIVKCDQCTAAVAELAASIPLMEIVEQLHDQYEPKQVVEAYLLIRQLVDLNVLATREPTPPTPPGLRSLTLLLAGGCNMACTYCFESDKPSYQKLNLLSNDTADRILRWFGENHRHSHMHLQLYGGEPLLNWTTLKHTVAAFKVLAKSQGKTHSIYMITNGTLLSEDRCQFLVENAVEIQISLDGDVDANKHRVLKGGGPTYEKVARWIPYLESLGANFNVRAVVTPTQPDPEVAISTLNALGAAKATYGVVSTEKEWLRFSGDDLSRLQDLQLKHIDSRMGRFAVAAEKHVVPANVRALANRIDKGAQIHYHCNAGVTEVTVTHDAKVYECQRLMGESIGSIDDQEWYARASKFLTPVGQKSKCSTCFARYNCGGGCKEANVLNTGEDHAWPEYCTVKRKEVEAAIILSYTSTRTELNAMKEKCSNESK